MKMATVAPGGVCDTAAMNQTKNKVRDFCRPTMMQMKPRATRMALGPTLDQFQARMSRSWADTTGVTHVDRSSARRVLAHHSRVRVAWFSTLSGRKAT